MDNDSKTTVGRSVLRGVAGAVWSWVAFAVVAGAVFITSPDMPAAWAGTTVEGVLSVLTFGFGTSVLYDEAALSVALDRLGPTLALLFETAVLAALCWRALVALAGRSEAGHRVATALAYLGGLSAVAWLTGLVWLGQNTPLPVTESATGPLSYWPAALALAVPVAAAFARLSVREAGLRDRVVDGWLFVSWLLGSLVLAESVLRIEGVGALVLDAGINLDFPAFLAAMSLLVLLALLASVGRELAWGDPPATPATPGREPGSARADGGVPGEVGSAPDGATALARDLLRESWRVRVGLACLVPLLGVGVLGWAFLSLSTTDVGLARAVPLTLASVVPAALLAWVVAALVGIGLGLFVARFERARTALLAAWFVANVPLLLWYYLATVAAGSNALPPGVGPAVLAVGVAPLVAVTAVSSLGSDTDVALGPERLLPAVGVAAVCAGVIALVHAQALGLVGIAPTAGVWGVLLREPLGQTAVRSALSVGLPAVALFLVGDGLREYARSYRASGNE